MAQVVYERGESDERPWGRWQVLDVGEGFVVKRITVKPGARLSLQYHHHRSEHWFIAKGRAEVTLDERVVELVAGQSVDIPVGTRHRILNPGSGPLDFIEVQYGERLDENDIVRVEDDFGRR